MSEKSDSDVVEVASDGDDGKVSARTTKVNIEDSRFSVDGVIAEMIIEVENPQVVGDSPAKGITDTPTKEAKVKTSKKKEFARNLGLHMNLEGETDPSPASEEQNNDNKTSKPAGTPKKAKSVNSEEKRKSSAAKEKEDVVVEPAKKKKNKPKLVLEKVSRSQVPVAVSSQVKLAATPSKTLGNIIADRLKKVDSSIVKSVFKILFDKKLKYAVKNALDRINEFDGFSFTKDSEEYGKRGRFMRLFPKPHLESICSVLGIPCKLKPFMIDDILSFFSKPVMSSEPIVLIQKLTDDDIKRICEELKQSAPSSGVKQKRKNWRVLKAEREAAEQKKKELEKRNEKPAKKSLAKIETPEKKGETRGRKKKLKTTPSKTNDTSNSTESTPKLKSDLSEESTTVFDDSPNALEVESKTKKQVIGSKRPSSDARRCRTSEKRRKPAHYGDWVDESTDSADSDFVPDSDSEEKKDVMPEIVEDVDFSPPKVKAAEAKGQKLRNFYPIVRSLETLSPCTLQRLHVILFGTSLPPEEMKKNILDFDGFSFSRDSEDWKQKSFVLSISTTHLLEFIEALHIDTKVESADSSGSMPLVDAAMEFLMCPQKKLMTQKSFYVVKSPKVAPKRKPETPPAKVFPVKKKKETPKPVSSKAPRHRKVLMDEATVRKMEMELAREQRAKKRNEVQNRTINLLGQSNPLFNSQTLKNYAISNMMATNVHKVAQSSSSTSTSNTSSLNKVKLQDNAHMKFMVVALDYRDLEVLHHFIFLRGAVKSKIRRSILDFDGFDFNEESHRYKVRKAILHRLGLPMVKRIAFILGLLPLDNEARLELLSSLIMQYLISPTRLEKLCVRDFPPTFFQDFPGVFDKNAVFSNIPHLEKTLLEESQISALNGDQRHPATVVTVKSYSGDNDTTSLQKFIHGLNNTEIITLDDDDYDSSDTNRKPMPMSARKSTSAMSPNASLFAGRLVNKPKPQVIQVTTRDGNKMKVLQPGGRLQASQPVQILSPTSVQNQHPLTPPSSGQKLLVDPTRLLLMTKGPNSQPLQIIPQQNLHSGLAAAASTVSKTVSSMVIIPSHQVSSSPTSVTTLKSSTVTAGKKGPGELNPPPLQRSPPTQQILLVQNLPNVQQGTPKSTGSPTTASAPQIILVPSTNPMSMVSSSPVCRAVSQPSTIGTTLVAPGATTGMRAPVPSSSTINLAHQLFQNIRPLKPGLAEELVLHQTKATGEKEKITFIKLPAGHPLVPMFESGQTTVPLKVTPVTSTETLVSVPTTLTQTATFSSPASSAASGLIVTPSRNQVVLSTAETVQGEPVIIADDFDEGIEDPSDDVLVEKITGIINSSKLDELTLKKVHLKLFEDFPNLNLPARRAFIKATIKNLICGPSSS